MGEMGEMGEMVAGEEGGGRERDEQGEEGEGSQKRRGWVISPGHPSPPLLESQHCRDPRSPPGQPHPVLRSFSPAGASSNKAKALTSGN